MSCHERLSAMWPLCHLHVSPVMLMFGRVLLQPGFCKVCCMVAQRKGAHQGAAMMSFHEVTNDLMR